MDEPDTKSPAQAFWTSLPGVLTGIAGLIAAVTGLLLFFGDGDDVGTAPTASSTIAAATATTEAFTSTGGPAITEAPSAVQPTATTTQPATTAQPTTTLPEGTVVDDSGQISFIAPQEWVRVSGEEIVGFGPSLTVAESTVFYVDSSTPGVFVVSSDRFAGQSVAGALALLGLDFRSSCLSGTEEGTSSDARLGTVTTQAFLSCKNGLEAVLNTVEVFLVQPPGESSPYFMMYQSGEAPSQLDYESYFQASFVRRNSILTSIDTQ